MDDQQRINDDTVLENNVDRYSEVFTNPVKLPDFVSDIYNDLSNPDLRERLQALLSQYALDLARYRADYLKATVDADTVRERLHNTEVELEDVRSAAALVIDGQDEALLNLKRRYDEELASLRSVSEHKVAELRVASQKWLETERANWMEECASHPTHLNMPQNTSLADRLKFMNSVERLNPQKLTTQALDTMGKVVRRVKVFTRNDTTTVPSSATEDSSTTPTVTTATGTTELTTLITTGEQSEPDRYGYVMRCENEIARLRRLLDESVLRNDPGFYDEAPQETTKPEEPADPEAVSPTHDQHTISAWFPGPKTILRASQTDLEGGDLKPTDTQSSLTEESWLRLQSKSMDAEQRFSIACAMCNNYEQQLQSLQTSQQQKNKNLQTLAQELSAKSTQLTMAMQNQQYLEDKLKTHTTELTERIERLERTLSGAAERLDKLLDDFQHQQRSMHDEINRLIDERQSILRDRELLQQHYDALLGRRSKAVAELSAQPIHLPSDKAELELRALSLYEENLSLRAAREHLDTRLHTDTQFLQQRLLAEQQEKANIENALQRELDELNARLESLTDIENRHDHNAALLNVAENEIKQLKSQLVASEAERTRVESELTNALAESSTLQQRLNSLLIDFNNAESVQADFVRLSQKLQVQLEQLRQQEHEVRWVDPDDVTACFACEAMFPSGLLGSNQKVNCRHCGKVHCANCTKHTFPSGPHGRPARVCDVCHTLLNKHAAPYFSTGVLQSVPAKTAQQIPTADSLRARSNNTAIWPSHSLSTSPISRNYTTDVLNRGGS